jgi:hypothetical protein
MGRKFSGGGTAGGGRSGRGGAVTYTRIIPPFLRGLVQSEGASDDGHENASADELDTAENRRAHVSTGEKDSLGHAEAPSAKRDDAAKDDFEHELAELRREGFHVDADAPSNPSANDGKKYAPNSLRVSGGAVGKRRKTTLQSSHASNAKPSARFSVPNSAALSFQQETGDSSGSSDGG